MSGLYFRTNLLSDVDHLQRQITTLFGSAPASRRSNRIGAFPQINVGTTDDSIEVVAFAPGIDPSTLDVSVENGLLTIAGERKPVETSTDTKQYARERFNGKFRRVIELSQYADPDKVEARYVDGCLLISIGKREASKPRSITVQ